MRLNWYAVVRVDNFFRDVAPNGPETVYYAMFARGNDPIHRIWQPFSNQMPAATAEEAYKQIEKRINPVVLQVRYVGSF